MKNSHAFTLIELLVVVLISRCSFAAIPKSGGKKPFSGNFTNGGCV